MTSLSPPMHRHGRFLVVALGFYVLATGLGLVLRAAMVLPVPGLNFGHALHAHSHTLYFGWVGLGLFALAYAQTGAPVRRARAVLGTLTALSAATFAAFLHGGYALPGMVVSGVALGVWLWAALVLWGALRGRTGLQAQLLRTGLVYMGLAVLGALARVGLLAAKGADPLWGRLAVFAFLHCFASFFLFSLLGLLAGAAPALGLRLDEARLGRFLRLAAPVAWATFPLGVEGGDAGWLGAGARVAALVLAVAELQLAQVLLRAARTAPPGPRAGVRWLGLWAGLQAVMGLAGALGLAGLAVQLRQPAILFLHVQLVGLVSGGLLLLLARPGRARRALLWLHHGAMALMGVGLGLASLAPWVAGVGRPGLLLAAAGGAGVVLAGALFLGAALWSPRQARSCPPVTPSTSPLT